MTPLSPRRLRDVTIEYRLVTDQGYAQSTQQKRWFFEVSPAHVGPQPWLELIQRIFYDANVALVRRDPSDRAWFYVDQVRAREVDVPAMLAWDGKPESLVSHLPWMASRIVWEPAACFSLADDGRYGPLAASDFTKLAAFRERSLPRLDDHNLTNFLELAFPGEGGSLTRCWREELDLLRHVPAAPPGVFRRAPGSAPALSGPPSNADIGPPR